MPAKADTTHPGAGGDDGGDVGGGDGVVDGVAPGESDGVDVGVGDALGHVIKRTFVLSASPTTTPPPGSTATHDGVRKVAAGPGPSTAPSADEPATVVTFPAGVTYRSDDASAT